MKARLEPSDSLLARAKLGINVNIIRNSLNIFAVIINELKDRSINSDRLSIRHH